MHNAVFKCTHTALSIFVNDRVIYMCIGIIVHLFNVHMYKAMYPIRCGEEAMPITKQTHTISSNLRPIAMRYLAEVLNFGTQLNLSNAS